MILSTHSTPAWDSTHLDCPFFKHWGTPLTEQFNNVFQFAYIIIQYGIQNKSKNQEKLSNDPVNSLDTYYFKLPEIKHSELEK